MVRWVEHFLEAPAEAIRNLVSNNLIKLVMVSYGKKRYDLIVIGFWMILMSDLIFRNFSWKNLEIDHFSISGK